MLTNRGRRSEQAPRAAVAGDVNTLSLSPGRAAATALLTVATSLSLMVASPSDSAASKVKVLGAAAPAGASCPADCLVEARVTGFQTSIGGRRNPFVVPAAGRIVAWSIKLGRPLHDDTAYFNRRFGRSRARISVLRPTKVRRPGHRAKVRYRLLRQSPTVGLRPFFGTTITFALPRALKAKKRDVVGLTLPTWAPVFSTGDLRRDSWRASRAPTVGRGPCARKGGQANLEAGGPQEQVGATQRYGCSYRGARLLYSARFVGR